MFKFSLQMENIGWFSDFVTYYGVPKEYGFVTVDLYEKQNIPQVCVIPVAYQTRM